MKKIILITCIFLLSACQQTPKIIHQEEVNQAAAINAILIQEHQHVTPEKDIAKLPHQHDDVWERIRSQLTIEVPDNDAVAKWRKYYLSHPNFMVTISKRAAGALQQHSTFQSEQELHHSNVANGKTSRKFITATLQITKRARALPHQQFKKQNWQELHDSTIANVKTNMSYTTATFRLQEVSTCEAAKYLQTECVSMREAHPAEGRNMLWGRGGRRPQPRASRGSAESNKERQHGKRMRRPQSQARMSLDFNRRRADC